MAGLAGGVAVITGAASGFGLQVSRLAAQRGMKVVMADVQADALEAAAEFEHLAGPRYQRLLQWEYNGRVIRAILEDSSPDNRAYVESITRSPWFPRVAVTPGLRPEQLNLELAFSPDARPPTYVEPSP